MASTAGFNKSSEQHRQLIAGFEVARLNEALAAELALTGSTLQIGHGEILWAYDTNSVIFHLLVMTKHPTAPQTGAESRVNWRAGLTDTSVIIAAIQENLKHMQWGQHNHATFATR